MLRKQQVYLPKAELFIVVKVCPLKLYFHWPMYASNALGLWQSLTVGRDVYTKQKPSKSPVPLTSSCSSVGFNCQEIGARLDRRRLIT